MFGIPTEELLPLAAALIAGGVMTGFLAGLLGIGGGAIIVPVLYHLFDLIGVSEDIRMHLCIGTSLAVIIPTSIRSLNSHRKRGSVDMKALRIWAIPVAGGVAIGSLIAAFASSDVLKIVFGVMLSLIGIQMLVFGSRAVRLTDDLPGVPLMSLYGLGIGLFSSLMGIGGGAFGNLIFAIHGRPVHQGVGTAAGLGLLIAVPGTIGFMIAGWPEMAELPPLSIGYVSVIGALLLAPISMLVAPLGARLAHVFSRRQLEVALGLFLIVMAGRFLIETLGELFT